MRAGVDSVFLNCHLIRSCTDFLVCFVLYPSWAVDENDPTASGANQLNPGGIIYCSRGDDTHVRKVHDEQLLIDALKQKYGEHSLRIWTGRGMSLAEQIMVFRYVCFLV